MMDILICLMSVFSSVSLIFSTIELLKTVRESKNILEMNKTKRELHKSIDFINQSSKINIDQLMEKMKNEDDYRIILYWYASSILKVIKENYPNYSFSLSIKSVDGDNVCTLLQTGDILFLNDEKQLVKNNTEYTKIINEGYEYFFVTDLNTFNAKNSIYISENSDWEYKYNTSIVFPIKCIDKNKFRIVGFICINSPQILKKKDMNNRIIKLLEKTSDNLADTILHSKMNQELVDLR